MLKALGHSRFSIRLCQCQVFPIKVFNHSIHQRRSVSSSNFSSNRVKSEISSSAFNASNYAKNVCKIIDVRRYTNGVDSDDDEASEGLGLTTQDDSSDLIEGTFAQLKNFLYADLPAGDDLLAKISDCVSEEEVLNVIKADLNDFAKHHAVLTLIKLWCGKQIKLKNSIVDVTDPLRTNAIFHCLLEKLAHHSVQMTLDELSVCLLYLTKLLVSAETDVMTTILNSIMDLMKNCQSSNISVNALSRFAVAANVNTQLYTYFVCRDILPHIFYHLERVDEAVDFRLITICLINVHQLISSNSLELFKQKVDAFLECGKLNDDAKTVFKILQLLSFPHWSQDHVPVVRKLMLLLEDKIENFQIRELEFMSAIFQTHFEPSSIGLAINKHAQDLLDQNPTAEVLACSALYATPDKRLKLTKLAKELIFSAKKPDRATMFTLFKILRLLKISDVNICDEYWSKVRTEVMTNPSEQETHILSRYCHRYMYFNNNLNGTYRHIPFERSMVDLIIKNFEQSVTTYLPSKFAKFASFILSYGHTPQHKVMFPEFIVQKMEAMAEQFSILDCVQLTRGIQIALQMRFKQSIHPVLASQIVRMENVLNACTERHLQQTDLRLNDLNHIVRSYNNRKSSRQTSIYDKIIRRYESIPHDTLTSRTVREITFNLSKANYTNPSLCESLIRYIVENEGYVIGDTVQKVLYCLYRLNYNPKSEEIFKCATKIIDRDFNYMSGLAIVNACLSLDFYKELSENLIQRVFNIEFIKRLEDEIEMCYSKAIYPQRVLNAVMQLNRAVCLDFPDVGVPWFQQNYIEAQMTKLPTVKSQYFNDVRLFLVDFASDESFIKIDHVTPYGYKIDFVLYFDQNKKLLKPPHSDDIVHKINKVGILLLDSDVFCRNDEKHISGQESLKQRHLEIMGYKVVQISYSQWNSMYMNLPGAKGDYLKELLSA